MAIYKNIMKYETFTKTEAIFYSWLGIWIIVRGKSWWVSRWVCLVNKPDNKAETKN